MPRVAAHGDSHGNDRMRDPAGWNCSYRIYWPATVELKGIWSINCSNSSERRLARPLLLPANFGKKESPEPIVRKISQETLAEMVGTTRARVSHFMNRFCKLGHIDYNGHLKVHNSLLNVVLCDKPETGNDDTHGRQAAARPATWGARR
jgi:hypothetical protein